MLEELLLTAVSDSDANAWVNTVQGAGGFVAGPQRRRVATLIRSLKAAGVWPTLDRLWLFAAENSTQALIDLKARATATIVAGGGAPIFTASRGYKGQHAGFINSGFNPTGGGVNYVENSGSYGFWVETAESAPASALRLMGNDSAGWSEFTTGALNYVFSVNNNGSNGGTGVSATAIGCMDLNRVAASGVGATTFYQNAVLTNSVAIASATFPNNSFFVLAGNNAGAAYQPSDARLAAAWIGSGKNATLSAALYAPLRSYMTAVGLP